MRKTIPFLFLLLISFSAIAQKKHSISGYVTDAASRELSSGRRFTTAIQATAAPPTITVTINHLVAAWCAKRIQPRGGQQR